MDKNDLVINLEGISFSFVQEVESGQNFSETYDKYNKLISKFNIEIPELKKEIREFGIY